MKKIASAFCLSKWFFIAFLISLGVSCKDKSGPTIGFMLPHMTLKRYPIERDVFTRRVHELGGNAVFMSSDNDEEKQIQQVNEILKKNIDILVLDPVNRFRAAEMVRAAHDKGVKVISYDRLAANCNVDAFMTFDASAIGKQMTQYALKKIPEGKYIILGGDKSDINAIMIDNAITKALSSLAKSNKIDVSYKTFIEKYSVDDAEFEIARFLKLSQKIPDVVLASSDMLANGALNAFKQFGLNGKVLITGQGGEVFACKNIMKGYQAMTIYKPVKKLANLVAELSVKMAKGENVNDYFKSKIFNGTANISSILLEVITVDATNLKSTLISDGMISEAELLN